MAGAVRYDTTGTWFKGALHIHTTMSDGRTTPVETATTYRDLGYDFMALTDHWVVSRDADDDHKWPLLVLRGVELNGHDHDGTLYHVVALGPLPDLTRPMELPDAIAAAREAGAFLIWAHPHCSGNHIADGLGHPFDAVEVYNHGCHVENNTGFGLVHWTGLLPEAPDMLVCATDDSHQREGVPDVGGGWTMVNCAELTGEAVLAALRAGNSYASNGPAFESIDIRDGTVRVTTSPVTVVRLLGPGWSCISRRAADCSLTSAEFEIPDDWAYVRLDIEDEGRNCAWTNTLFTTGE
jgi:hypothetical protein